MPGAVLAEGDAPAMSRPRKYSDELRERAVRFYFEQDRPIAHVAHDLGIHKEALRQWVRQAWKQLRRQGFAIGRDRVARWMRQEGLEGFRSDKMKRHTIGDETALE